MFVPTLDRSALGGAGAGASRNPARDQYLAGAVSTASPQKLLVMLYDRLVLDLDRAERVMRDVAQPLAVRRAEARVQILHAQDIVIELRSSLDLKAGWDGAAGLSELYGFVLTQLIQANISMDADRVASCRSLLEPLRDAWHEAAAACSAAVPASA
jgi:flagellar protein FliS